MKINHKYQPSGNSCGPTCLYMAGEYVRNKTFDLPWKNDFPYEIEQISEMCGTDWIVGTPPDRLEKGMKAIGLRYVEYLASPKPYELLRQIFEIENVPILRTITQGIPHWIIVSECMITIHESGKISYSKFIVLDPWLGKIEYTKEQLDAVWKPRNYQLYEILSNDAPIIRF